MHKRFIVWMVFAAMITTMGCAHRAALRDDAGRPISRQEVEAKKKHSNLVLFAIGGGALSFGASFFVGSLIDRSSDSSNQTALWVTTGIGTAIGLAYFIQQGAVRDHNLAVQAVRRERLKGLSTELETERQRRERIEAEKRRLLEERKRQEEERKKLLEALKKRQKEKQ